MAVLGEDVSKEFRSGVREETVAVGPATSEEIEIPLEILKFFQKNPEYNYFFSLAVEQGDELEFEQLKLADESKKVTERKETKEAAERVQIPDKKEAAERVKIPDKNEKDKLHVKNILQEEETLEIFDTYEPQFEQIDQEQEYEKLKQALFSGEISLDLEIDLNIGTKSNSLTFSEKSAPKLSKEEESYINHYQLFQTPADPGSTCVITSAENSIVSGAVKEANIVEQFLHSPMDSVKSLVDQKPIQIEQLEKLQRLVPRKPNWTRYIQKNSKKEFPIKKSFFIDKLSKRIWKLLITEIEAYRKIYEILEKENSNPEIEYFLEATKNALICTFEQQKTELLSLHNYNFVAAKPKRHLKFSDAIVERMIFSFESESVSLVLVDEKALKGFDELKNNFLNLGNEFKLQMRWFPLSTRMHKKMESTLNKVESILKSLSCGGPRPS